MSKSKKGKLLSLLGILVLVCAAAFAVSRWEEKKEAIKNSDEIILSIDPSSVTALSWEYGDTALAFHRDGDWLWDEDEAFPVDGQKIADLLAVFEEFGVSFRIEEVEDYGQYGLLDPEATIRLTAAETEYEIVLGNFSTLDSERYVSVGDGNVYLVKHDPLEDYELTIRELILDDEIPELSGAVEIAFDGTEAYTVTYEEESTKSCCAEDVYFAEDRPLDTDRVDSYLTTIQNLSGGTYVSYNASEEELTAFGLDTPELTVTVICPVSSDEEDEEDGEEEPETQSFVLSVGRNREELAEAAESDEEDAEDSVSAYFRIGESRIVYELPNSAYKKLTACAYDDLRHTDLVTADFDEIEAISFTLEGVEYRMTAREPAEEDAEDSGETRVWDCGSAEEITISGIQSAITALSASAFTEETPTQKEEIRFTLYLSSESFPELEITLYRYDGESCLAQVNGESTAFVPRSQVVDLIEAVNALVLGGQS